MSIIKQDYGTIGNGGESILLLFEQYDGSTYGTGSFYTDSDIDKYCTLTGSSGNRTLTFKQAIKGIIILGRYYAGTSVSGTATLTTLTETYQGTNMQIACYTLEAEKDQTIIYNTTASGFSSISIIIEK